jgi:hypothetical protein
MTLHFPESLTKPFDLNVNAASTIKCKIHFKVSSEAPLVCLVVEDIAPKSCYGIAASENGDGTGMGAKRIPRY